MADNKRKISDILTSTCGIEKQKAASGVRTLADNIIVMRHELKDKAREAVIIKRRRSPDEMQLASLDITTQGLTFHD